MALNDNVLDTVAQTSSFLKDEDLYIDSNPLSVAVSNWKTNVDSLDLASVNILGTFAPLIDFGVGNTFFEQLNDGLRSINEGCASIVESINFLITTQNDIDKDGQNQVDSISSYTNVSGQSFGGATSSNYEETTTVEVENMEEKFEDCVSNLTEYEQVLLIHLARTSSGDNLKELIYGEGEESIIKFQEELKKMDSLPIELRDIISNMKPQEVKVMLKNLLLNGKQITDFSKLVFTSYKGDKSAEEMNKLSKNFLSTFNSIDDDNIGKDLNNIYTANVSSSVSNETIELTREFVNTVAQLANTSPEELLTDPKHVNTLQTCSLDLIKTFAYIDATCSIGPEAIQSLLSNMELKA